MNKKIKMLALGLTVVLLPTIGQAYVGPGAGLSAIGSFLALVLALFAAVLGFLWYPIKRLFKGNKGPTLEEKDNLTTSDLNE